MEANLRAFVSGCRISPALGLNEQWPYVNVVNYAVGQIGWSASGSLSRSQSGTTTTVTWSGAGNFNLSSGTDETFEFSGLIDVPGTDLAGGLGMAKANGLHIVTRSVSSLGTTTQERDENFSVAPPPCAWFAGMPGLSLQFDRHWSLLPGSQIFSDNGESVLGQSNCETQVTWTGVVPYFPP